MAPLLRANERTGRARDGTSIKYRESHPSCPICPPLSLTKHEHVGTSSLSTVVRSASSYGELVPSLIESTTVLIIPFTSRYVSRLQLSNQRVLTVLDVVDYTSAQRRSPVWRNRFHGYDGISIGELWTKQWTGTSDPFIARAASPDLFPQPSPTSFHGEIPRDTNILAHHSSTHSRPMGSKYSTFSEIASQPPTHRRDLRGPRLEEILVGIRDPEGPLPVTAPITKTAAWDHM